MNPNIECRAAEKAVCLGGLQHAAAYETYTSCGGYSGIICDAGISPTLIATLHRAGQESVPNQAQGGASGQGGHPGAVPEAAAVRAHPSFRPTSSTPLLLLREGPTAERAPATLLTNRAFDVVLKDVAARSERAPTVRMSDLSAHAGQHEGSSDEDDEVAVPSTSGNVHVADPVQLATAAKCVCRPARADQAKP